MRRVLGGANKQIAVCGLLGIRAPIGLIRGCVGHNKGHWGMCWEQRRVFDALLIVITPINVLVTASSLKLSMPSAQLSDRSLLAAVATCSTSP